MATFYEAENLCQFYYSQLGPCWHLYTPENFEIILTSKSDFALAMTIFGIAALLFPDVKILTFELMGNHLHVTLAGPESSIRNFFSLFWSTLVKNYAAAGRYLDKNRMQCNLRAIESCDDLRNVIVYNNRNGFLVRPEFSPFSYPYGANSYYFNPVTRDYYSANKEGMSIREMVRIFRSHSVRSLTGAVFTLYGYVCPLCFCDIDYGEKLFRDASHYFYCLSRNVESQKKIAREIGDRVFYNEDELYSAANSISRNKFGLIIAQLPVDSKMILAKTLHYDYNASNKQLQRILKLDATVLSSMFPQK